MHSSLGVVQRATTTAEIGHDDSGTVPFDVVSLLGDRRRMNVLASLEDAAAPIALAELARELVDDPTGDSPEDPADCTYADARTDPTAAAVQRVATSLYHVHVPQLVDAGVVEYDMDRDLIRPTDRTDRIQRALSVVDAADQ